MWDTTGTKTKNGYDNNRGNWNRTKDGYNNDIENGTPKYNKNRINYNINKITYYLIIS